MKTNQFFLVSLIFLAGCTLNPNQTWKNESINKDLKAEIHQLNERVIDAYIQNQPEKLIGLTGKAMLDVTSPKELTTMVEQISQYTIQKDFKIIDEYYVSNTSKGGNNVLFGEEYKIVYRALNREMYTSLLEIQINPISSILLTLIYGKYGEDWKINIIRYGDYACYGKTAVYFYQKAKKLQEKGHLIDATKNLYVAQQLYAPINGIGKYSTKEPIDNLLKKIEIEVYEKYHFPIEVSSISSKPSILNINPNLVEEGPILDFTYYTNINLNDTLALEQEYLKLLHFVGKEFKGVLEENNFFLFNAVNQIPDGETPVNAHLFIHEVK